MTRVGAALVRTITSCYFRAKELLEKKRLEKEENEQQVSAIFTFCQS